MSVYAGMGRPTYVCATCSKISHGWYKATLDIQIKFRNGSEEATIIFKTLARIATIAKRIMLNIRLPYAPIERELARNMRE